MRQIKKYHPGSTFCAIALRQKFEPVRRTMTTPDKSPAGKRLMPIERTDLKDTDGIIDSLVRNVRPRIPLLSRGVLMQMKRVYPAPYSRQRHTLYTGLCVSYGHVWFIRRTYH